jgi:hypothetical protein
MEFFRFVSGNVFEFFEEIIPTFDFDCELALEFRIQIWNFVWGIGIQARKFGRVVITDSTPPIAAAITIPTVFHAAEVDQTALNSLFVGLLRRVGTNTYVLRANVETAAVILAEIEKHYKPRMKILARDYNVLF